MQDRSALGIALSFVAFVLGCGGSGAELSLIGVSGILDDTNPDPTVVEVSLTARFETIDIGDFAVPMMTYDGVLPGPALVANVGDRVLVHFTNELDQPTTIHWHGVRVPNDMDGSPTVRPPIGPGESFTYDFIVPEAATFWFHPHFRANVQVEHGLYAPMIVHSPLDPAYDADRVLVLDDVLLDDSGVIVEPFVPPLERDFGRLGNVALTNGRPSASSTGRAREGDVERWRLLNVTNARTMHVRFVGAVSTRVIATDGGLLPSPYTFTQIDAAIGQRYDVEVSYTGSGDVTLEALIGDPGATPEWVVMHRVDVRRTGRAPRVVPYPVVPPFPTRVSTRTETFLLERVVGMDSLVHWSINGQIHPMAPLFTFPLGDTVILRINNQSFTEHPFHLHGQFFTILDGTGLPSTTEPGLKDTVLVPAYTSRDVLAYLDNEGRWMAHCHILEHADLGMMSEIVVGTAP